MARYTPEFLAAARHGYENTDRPMTALAIDLGIGITTLQTLVRKQGWTPRSQRTVDSPSALRLLAEAQALAAGSSSLPHGTLAAPPTPDPSPPRATLVVGGEQSAAVLAAPAQAAPTLSPAERLEALVVKELEAEEAARAELVVRPRSRNDAERCARTLSVLTQTLQTLQRMRAGGDGGSNACAYDDMPADLDAFRDELARQIDALLATEPPDEETQSE